MAESKNLEQSCKLQYIHGSENIFGLTIKLIYLSIVRYETVRPPILFEYSRRKKLNQQKKSMSNECDEGGCAGST